MENESMQSNNTSDELLIDPEFVCKADQAMNFRLVVEDENESLSSCRWFHPIFTYQMVGRSQLLTGFKDLSIDITLNGSTLESQISIRYSKSQSPDLEKELRNLLQSHLPSFDKTTSGKFQPPGSCIDSRTIQTTCQNGEILDQTFQVFECALTDEKMQNYFRKLEKFGPFFIEGADSIDVTNPKWTIFVLYQVVSNKTYRFCGYITRFTFINPVVRQDGQTQPETQRICQVLVLPPFQGQGHCAHMVELIMKGARENSNLYEVNVEDPVPKFSSIRTLLDLRAMKQHGFDETTDWKTIRQKLKVTRKQIEECCFILQYEKVRGRDENESELKNFRLKLKKHLYLLYLKTHEAQSNEILRKAFLRQQYSQKTEAYDRLLSHLLKR